MFTVYVNNKLVTVDAVLALLDDEIMEQLHVSAVIDEWSMQQYVDEYCIAHENKFDETFEAN